MQRFTTVKSFLHSLVWKTTYCCNKKIYISLLLWKTKLHRLTKFHAPPFPLSTTCPKPHMVFRFLLHLRITMLQTKTLQHILCTAVHSPSGSSHFTHCCVFFFLLHPRIFTLLWTHNISPHVRYIIKKSQH